MPIDINYNEFGKPKTVLLAYDEYQDLLGKLPGCTTVRQPCGAIEEPPPSSLQARFTGLNDDLASGEGTVATEGSQKGLPTAQLQTPIRTDVRRYKNATGYYDQSGRFVVLKGSRASGCPSPTFKKRRGRVAIREYLIEKGILAREGPYGDYMFTEDWPFGSSSAAAGIIDGNSRSGTKAWGKRYPEFTNR